MNIKKYWLRGGIIGIAIGVFFSIYQSTRNWCVGSYLNLDGTMGSVCPPVNILDNMIMLAIPELLTILVLFIVGSIAGWIYGKIKTRRQVGLTSN